MKRHQMPVNHSKHLISIFCINPRLRRIPPTLAFTYARDALALTSSPPECRVPFGIHPAKYRREGGKGVRTLVQFPRLSRKVTSRGCGDTPPVPVTCGPHLPSQTPVPGQPCLPRLAFRPDAFWTPQFRAGGVGNPSPADRRSARQQSAGRAADAARRRADTGRRPLPVRQARSFLMTPRCRSTDPAFRSTIPHFENRELSPHSQQNIDCQIRLLVVA